MSKHPPSPPPRLGAPEPACQAAPPPRRPDERGSPRAHLISCQQPFVWEEGSHGETKRQRARREGAGRPCHAEAARRRRRESWRGRLRFLSRGSGVLPRLPRPRAYGSGPETCSRPARARISLVAVAPGGAVRARPLLAAPLPEGPHRLWPWRPPSQRPQLEPAEAWGPVPGEYWAARRSCCQTTPGPPSRSHGQAEQKLPMSG